MRYKNSLCIRPANGRWEVEYESYFNPHANPKQLMDIKLFDTFEEAFDWSKKYLQDKYGDDEFIITDLNYTST